MKIKLTCLVAVALLLAACGGTAQLGSDDTGIGANGHLYLDGQGFNVGGGADVHLLGHGVHTGAGLSVK